MREPIQQHPILLHEHSHDLHVMVMHLPLSWRYLIHPIGESMVDIQTDQIHQISDTTPLLCHWKMRANLVIYIGNVE
jgi:hypothetical protein